MKKSNELKILKYISIVLMILFFLIGLLLPLPYEGKQSSLFFLIENGEKNSDVRAIILFELLMLVCFSWSFSIFKFTNIPTIDEIQNKLAKMEVNYKLSSQFSKTVIKSLEEEKEKDFLQMKNDDLITAKKLEVQLKKDAEEFKKQLKEKNDAIKKLEKESGLYQDLKNQILEEEGDEDE